MSKPYTYVCTECGSDAVTLEGFIHWNAEKQEYDVSNLCDKGHSCNECDGECNVEAIEIPPTPSEALSLLEDLASTFVGDWLSDEGMSAGEKKEAWHADVRMRAAMTLLRKLVTALGTEG